MIRCQIAIKINLMRFIAETFDLLFRFIIFNIRLGQKKKKKFEKYLAESESQCKYSDLLQF